MKSFRIADTEAITHDKVMQAILKPSLGKRDRADVKRVLDHMEESIEKIQNMLINHEFEPKKHEACIINEKGPHKQREILKPDYMPEQIVHHIAVDAMKEATLHGMYAYVLGSIPKRGAHLGKKVIERWIREDPEHTRIVGKMDIHHFFQSVDHNILREWIRKKIRPGEIRNLLELLIDATEMGLPLGFYTSQWFANFLLQPLDHYIKEVLKVKYMTRYMDDIVIFGSNKKEVHRAVNAIREYLQSNFKLTMKDNWQVFRFEYESNELAITCSTLKELCALDNALTEARIQHKCKMHKGKRKIFLREATASRKRAQLDVLMKRYHGTEKAVVMLHGRALDYMGFEFHRNRTVLRKSIMLSATRKANQISKTEKVCWKQASSFLSYMGWIDKTDTYTMYEKRIKPKVSVKKMKQIVSKANKRKKKENFCNINAGDARSNFHCWGGLWEPADGVENNQERQCSTCRHYKGNCENKTIRRSKNADRMERSCGNTAGETTGG